MWQWIRENYGWDSKRNELVWIAVIAGVLVVAALLATYWPF